MKKSIITYVLVMGLSLITLLLVSLNRYFVFLSLVLLFSYIFMEKFEYKKKLVPLINEFFIRKDYEKALLFLNKFKNDTFFLRNANGCIITIIQIYMLQDRIDDIKELISQNKRLANNINISYIRMIISISDEDLILANRHYNKLCTANPKYFRKQQDMAKLIMDMINNKEYNETILEETNYESIKRLCYRYRDCNYIDLPNNIKESNVLANLLSAFSILSLLMAVILIVVHTYSKDIAIGIERLYYFLTSAWIFYLFIPIPFASFLYWKIGTGNKINKKVGFVVTIMLFILGCLNILSLSFFTSDENYLDALEYASNIELPESASIITQDYNGSSGDNLVKYISVIRYDELDEEKLIVQLNNNIYWNDFLTDNIKEFVPDAFETSLNTYHYYCLYNIDDNSYNMPYDYNDEYLIYGINLDENVILIYQFYKK